MNTMVIMPGCVYIKNALSQDEQIKLATLSKKWEEKLLPSTVTRNRVYDAIDRFPNPDYLLKLSRQLLSEGNVMDKEIIVDAPTHLLFLQYNAKRGMGFHRDDSANDGSKLNPVLSISLGNSCVFSIKHIDTNEQIDVVLNSGDVIMFGGQSRFMQHSVGLVAMNCPDYLIPIIGKARLNYTMRYAPEILGKEEQYKIFDAVTYRNNINKTK